VLDSVSACVVCSWLRLSITALSGVVPTGEDGDGEAVCMASMSVSSCNKGLHYDL
jgi:hypothetical protein